MGRVCVGRLCYGPSLQWAEFAMGRDVQLPNICTKANRTLRFLRSNLIGGMSTGYKNNRHTSDWCGQSWSRVKSGNFGPVGFSALHQFYGLYKYVV